MGVELQERWCGLLEMVRTTLAIHERSRLLLRDDPRTVRSSLEQTDLAQNVLQVVVADRKCREMEASFRFIIAILSGAEADQFDAEFEAAHKDAERSLRMANRLNQKLTKMAQQSLSAIESKSRRVLLHTARVS